MNFLKPKFWDNDKSFIYPILLIPIALLISLIGKIKKILVKKHSFSIPVICIGNIYLGGTGKTPFSIKLFAILKDLKKNPAFVRKKYDSFQDEVSIQKLTGKVYQNNKRSDAINEAIKNNADIVILDDGYQDVSINKNLNIVCFNEKQWSGNGFLLPSGPLRERLSALKRANYVIINGEKNINIENEINKNNNKIKIFYTKYKAENINEFRNKKIISFAGIGNPSNFFDLLRENKIDLLEEISFPDHYQYSSKDLNKLIEKSEKNNAILLTTEKDYHRINNEYKKNIHYLKIKIEIREEEKFIEEIKKII